jgi:signal transduction histidine kinase
MWKRGLLPTFKPSLRTRLAGLMIFTSMSLIAVLVIFYYQTEKALYNEFERQTAELSKAVQIGLEGATGKNLNDAESLEGYLNKLNPQGIKEISVISGSDRIIASTRRENVGKWVTERRKELLFKAELGEPVTGEGQNYNVIIPVASGGATVGFIHLTLNTEDFSVFLRLSAIRRVIAALAILGIGTLVAILLAGRYTRPIEEVVAAAGQVAAGDLEQELPVERRDEIGDLARSFNYMVARLREDRDLKERLRTAEHQAGVGQFASSIAHEIKNPLNFISLSIDHIRDAYLPEAVEKARKFESLVENIKGEIQRISRFAESFLEYGRPFELRLRQGSMTKILDQVLELVEARAAEAGIRIVKACDPLPELTMDPEFIRTCLYNLIINAFDAMPGGGELKIRAERTPSGVSVVFADSGTGVDEASLGRIFEPFFTTKGNGLGLGLALTRRIVEEHGGKVDFESHPGKGSVVTLHLPTGGEVEG